MNIIKVRALVIKEYEAGESDKRLLLLCKEKGRILVRVRGARKPKSKFVSSAQVFAYSDFVLSEGNGFYSVNQADIIESFYGLRTDYDKLMNAALIVNSCAKVVLEDIQVDDLLYLTLISLKTLVDKPYPPIQTSSVFLLRMISWYGFQPETENYVKLPSSPHSKIYITPDGIIRSEDSPNAKNKLISESTAKALNHIITSDVKKSFSFNVSENVLKEVESVCRLLWNFHFADELGSYYRH